MEKAFEEFLKPIGYYNDTHGFLHDEIDKDCYCIGGCNMAPVYTEDQVKEMLSIMSKRGV